MPYAEATCLIRRYLRKSRGRTCARAHLCTARQNGTSLKKERRGILRYRAYRSVGVSPALCSVNLPRLIPVSSKSIAMKVDVGRTLFSRARASSKFLQSTSISLIWFTKNEGCTRWFGQRRKQAWPYSTGLSRRLSGDLSTRLFFKCCPPTFPDLLHRIVVRSFFAEPLHSDSGIIRTGTKVRRGPMEVQERERTALA